MIVADTGPLIALARAERLDLLRILYGQVLVPAAVHAELTLDSGRPGAKVLAGAFEAGWMTTQPTTESGVISELMQLIDIGEAEAIALVEELGARFLLIDDAKGRRIARRRGVAVVGVAGVLLAAKSRGVLTAVGPALEDMSASGYRLSAQLIAAVLAKAGE